MRVFIVGTGRCGTLTCAKAAGHATNYTSGHETKIQPHLVYPDNHIEVSARLTWVLPLLGRKYPSDTDVLWVHMTRDRQDVIDSWVKRGRRRGPGYWQELVWKRQRPRPPIFPDVCAMCYDAMYNQIEDFLATKTRKFRIKLESGARDWENLWGRIGAEGHKGASMAEWGIKYNATPAADGDTSPPAAKVVTVSKKTLPDL